MEYRNLGRTGVKISMFGLGSLLFGKPEYISDPIDIIDQAIDAGINYIDTANVYAGGASEEIIGKALQKNGKRSRIILATKVHFSVNRKDPNACGNSRHHIIQQCDRSLQRLQTDYIDLYQIHRPSSEVAIDETLRALDDLIRSGKVRYIGTSTFAAWQIVEALWASNEFKLNRIISEHPPYHILDRSIERELIPMALTYDVAILPWSPLAGGFISGKYNRDLIHLPIKGTKLDRHFNQYAFDALDIIKSIALEKQCTPSQFALAWCTRQPGITAPIIGPRTVQQLENSLGAVDIHITDEDRRRIDAVTPPGQTINFPEIDYQADFGPHQYRW